MFQEPIDDCRVLRAAGRAVGAHLPTGVIFYYAGNFMEIPNFHTWKWA